MSENIIDTPSGQLIFNGGDPLNGCPKSFEEADAWAAKANDNDKREHPKWKFDCGFKLDYDGPIISISSRFYPPKTHYDPTWDGNITVYLLGDEVAEKHFECKTLNELKKQVEKYIQEQKTRIWLTLYTEEAVNHQKLLRERDRLLKNYEQYKDIILEHEKERDELKQQLFQAQVFISNQGLVNSELLEALKELERDTREHGYVPPSQFRAAQLIAKAEGKEASNGN